MNAPKSLIDTFEHWLQGLVNTCVSGLDSRLNRLEEQAGYAKRLEADQRLEAMENALARFDARLDRIENDDNLGLSERTKGAVERIVESKLEETDFAKIFKDSDGWEDEVTKAVVNDPDFIRAIKDAISDMRFEVHPR